MTVRDRAFRRYTGPVTPRRWRFLVLWRYARREIFVSRRVTALYALSFVPILVAATIIYLRHNLPALAAMQIDATELVPVDGDFFLFLLRIQAMFAFLLTAFVGPGLVSPDLANNGLPLYLCRPFSRAEYVLGKMSAVVVLTSSMTWLPLLLLVVVQSALEPGWLGANAGIAWGLFAGSWIAILLLALLALALSAWIKWQMLAGAMTVASVLVANGVAEFVNGIFRTRWGDLLSPGKLVFGLWEHMLRDVGAHELQVPALAAWLALGLFGACCLLVLHVKLRAYEVVR